MARATPEEVLELHAGHWMAQRILRKLDEAGWTTVTKAELQALRRSAARLEKLGGAPAQPAGRKPAPAAKKRRPRGSTAAA